MRCEKAAGVMKNKGEDNDQESTQSSPFVLSLFKQIIDYSLNAYRELVGKR